MMKKILTVLSALILTLFASSAYAAADYIEGQVLVVLKNNNNGLAGLSTANAAEVCSAAAKSLASTVNANVVSTYNALSASSGHIFTLISSPTKTANELERELKQNPNVIAVSKNYFCKIVSPTKNEAVSAAPDACGTASRFDEQWGLKKINVEKAWETTEGDRDVVVAVIDTGVMYDHPDLKDNIWDDGHGHCGKMFYSHSKNYDYLSLEAMSNDKAVYQSSVDICTDGVSGGKISGNWERVGDINGHGTHVAGIIGAVGNVVNGVNKTVKILPVGVFSVLQLVPGLCLGLGALYSDITSGLEYIAELKQSGVNIVAANMSLGGWTNEPSQYYFEVLDAASRAGDKGILMCIAAGNEEQDIDNPNGDYSGAKPYPAYFCTQIKNSLCVGASASNDVRSGSSGASSNYSSLGKSVSVFAPGEQILSTCISYDIYCETPGDYPLVTMPSKGYGLLSGTSMATPMVTGAAALLAAAFPDKSASEIKRLLTRTATNVCRKGFSRYGQIDLAAAMRAGNRRGNGGIGCNAGLGLTVLLGVSVLIGLKKKRR
ncbi:MAG: S8 family serine peptidase [Synergistes sp.]|nr:S8 family serine peptidase [Synergistes sp.]